MKKDDEVFMREALKEAKKAYKKNEVPIGAVVVKNNKIIGRGHNLVERSGNAAAHAEIHAIAAAAKKAGGWRLNGCSLYATVEPCLMCFGASMLSRVSRIVYGAAEPKFGSIRRVKKLPGQIEIKGGVLVEESRKLLKKFFRKLRKK